MSLNHPRRSARVEYPTRWRYWLRSLSYAELNDAFLGRGDLIDALYEQQETMGDAIDGMDTKIEHLNTVNDQQFDTIKMLQDMAQHTVDALNDAFHLNQPNEDPLALIEAAGYRISHAETTIRQLNGRLSDGENEIATLTTLWRDAKALSANRGYAIDRVNALCDSWANVTAAARVRAAIEDGAVI